MRLAALLVVLFSACSCAGGAPIEDASPANEGSGGEVSPGAGGAGEDDVGTGGEFTDSGLRLIGDGTNQCDDCPQLGDSNEFGEVLVFSDDFVKDDLDRTIWKQETGMVRNQEQQCYLDRPENIQIQDGELLLIALPGSISDPICSREWVEGEGAVSAAYTSASVTTRDIATFRYGRIEARLKIPDATGVWPAFWMLPQERVYGGWPFSGEVDVMEHVSQEPNTIHGTAHFDFLGHASDGSPITLEKPVTEDFHIVAINWTPQFIEWSLDGQSYHRFEIDRDIQGRRPFDESFYLILNVAVGGHWPEPPVPSDYPASLRVDWVRVWQVPEVPVP